MTMAGGSSDFGRYLQAFRQAKGISLASVAERTRIRLVCLQQIENEDLRHLPDPVFVKGFLRAYAEVVGADAQEAVIRYETGLSRRLKTGQTHPQKHPRARYWLRFALATIILAGVIATTLHLSQRMQISTSTAPMTQPAEKRAPEAAVETMSTAKKDVSEPVAAAPADESGQTGQEMSQKDLKTTQETPAPVESPRDRPKDRLKDRIDKTNKTELILEISAVEVTWLKIIADGQYPKVFSMQPGEQIALTAKSHFNLLIGNAGGIRLTLDGRSIQIPGKSGQVVTMQLP